MRPIECMIWSVVPVLNLLFFYLLALFLNSEDCHISSIHLRSETNHGTSYYGPNQLLHVQVDKLNPERRMTTTTTTTTTSGSKLGSKFLESYEVPYHKRRGEDFMEYHNRQFSSMHFPYNTLIVSNEDKLCSQYSNVFADFSEGTGCLAIVKTNTSHAYNLQRFKYEPNIQQIQYHGFFSRTGNLKGRVRTIEKMQSMIGNLTEIEILLKTMLSSHHIYAGDEVIVMVVNDGEMDLFINFACSAHLHKIMMEKVMVFCASR